MLRNENAPENNENTTTFFTKCILNGYLDIVKCDVSGTGSGRVTRLDLRSFDTGPSFYQDNSEAIFRLASDREVIGKPGKNTSASGIQRHHAITYVPLVIHFLFPVQIVRYDLYIEVRRMHTIYNPVFAVLGFDGSRLKSHDITTGKCLRDGQTDKFLSGEHVRNNSGLEFFAAEVEHWRKANDFATEKTYLNDEVFSLRAYSEWSYRHHNLVNLPY
jgi:hypothetical protein